MADDVKIGIGGDASGLRSAFSEVASGLDKLKRGAKGAAGILEGDRRVENKMSSWVRGFAEARSGADLLSNTLGNLGDVFRASLVIGVALNVGAELVKMFANNITKMGELKKSAEEAGEALRQAMLSGNTSSMESGLARITDEIKKIKAELEPGAFRRALQNPLAAPEAVERVKKQREEDAGLPGLESQRQDAADALVKSAERSLEITRARASGETEVADKLAQQEALQKRIADIDAKNYPTKQRNQLVAMELEKAALDEKIKANDVVAKADAEATQRHIKEADAAAKASIESREKEKTTALKILSDIEEAELAAEANIRKMQEDTQEQIQKRREDSEKASIDSIISFNQEKYREYWRWLEGEAKNARDRITEDEKRAAARRAELEKRITSKKNELDAAESEYKREGEKKIERLAGGETLPMQRKADMDAATLRFKQASVVARDEARKEFGNNSNRLRRQDAKDFVANRVKELTDKDDWQKNVQECKKSLEKLEKKLGVK